MTTLLNSDNIQPSTLEQLQNVRISNIQVTNSSYVVLDDTAVSLSGGYIKITGSNFNVGVQVYVGSTLATSITRVNSTEINAQIGAGTAGSYIVYVVNTNGSTGIRVNGVTYSGSPTWVTSSTLPNGENNSPISIQLSATGDSPLVYTLQTGSVLPTGLTLTSGGLLSGTISGLTAETTYNFTIEVTDPELQESPRSFTITITTSDVYFAYVNLLFSASTPGSTFVSDASTNQFTITVTGDARPNNFGPYTPGYYSNFFDGNGDFLTVPSSANVAFNLNNTDWTIEFWFYAVATPSNSGFGNMIIQAQQGTNNWLPYVSIGVNSSLFLVASINAVQYTTSQTFAVNVWNHVALVRNSGVVRLYLNGVATSVAPTADIANTNLNFWIGKADNAPGGGGYLTYFNGYISNLRIVKGTAVYTSAFTPPTSPLTAISGTSLLTCQSNRFIDTSTNNFAITVSGNTTINGFDPFVPASDTATFGSGYFDGTGDWLTFTGATTGSGNFTTEAWVYLSTLRDYQLIFDNRATGASATGYAFGVDAAGKPYMYTNNAFQILSTIVITSNIWNHLALVRNGTTITLYVNGVSGGSYTSSANFSDTNNGIGIAPTFTPTSQYFGYISNLRIVNGTAVYTTTFTPPTSPLTAISGTSLLTLQSNQPNNSSMFVDNSSLNNLITRSGNTTQGSFSPYPGTWSNYFDGTDDFLSYASTTTLNFGTSDFTVECWINIADVSTTRVIIGGTASNAFGFRYGRSYLGAAGLGIYREGQADLENCAFTFVAGIWYHVAVVRQSSVIYFYINGVQQTTSGSGGGSYNFPTETNVRVGSGGGGLEDFFGYISNLRVTKNTALYTTNFTPPTQPLTPIAGTSLLTCADNRLIDDSNNNFTLTRNGGVSVQKFSPFTLQTQIVPTSYSVYFDGTGDWLTFTGATTGSGNFTTEAWVYLATLKDYQVIFDNRATGASATGYAFGVDAAGKPYMFTNNGFQILSSIVITANSWNHLALVRNTTTVTLYVNGVSGGTYTSSANFSDTNNGVGVAPTFTPTSQYFGYISNLRIVNGTAVYTANFTPSTTPLTAISNTSLLTCQSTTIIDNSTNNFTITVNGNSQPLPQNPFGYTNPTQGPYTVSALGGSMYFDGTGDTLTIASSTINQFGSGNFTIETWYYSSGSISTAGQHLFFRRTTTTAIGLIFQVDSSRLNLLAGDSNTGGWEVNISSTTTLVAGTWYHFAMSRSGSTWRIFVNGALENTATSSFTIAEESANITIGTSITGYLSNYRIVKGQALYTSSFVPPAAPVTAVRNSVLLLNGTSAGVTDSSMIANYETVGGAIVTTSLEYYGSNSVFFNGTNSGLFSASSVQHSFGSGNFTIEFWYYPTSTAGTNPNIMCNNNAGSFVSGMWSFHAPHSSYPNKYSLWVASFNTGAAILVSTSNIAINTWTFVTITRTTNTWRMFINGTIQATATHSGVFDNGGSYPQFIGYQPGVESGRYITGYMCDIRFTKGVSRYAANFTPPTTPFIRY